MRSQVLAFSISIILGVVFQPSQGQDCPLHEQPVDCIDFCNTCESDSRTCKFICIPGCDCKLGYKRNKVGYCIPRRFCKDTEGTAHHGCPDATKCGKSCTDRGYESGTCVGPRKLKCQCHLKKPKVDDKPNPHGCPNNTLCNISCKSRGFLSGKCTGVNSTVCKCRKHPIETSPVNPDKIDTVADSGICPSKHRCAKSCTRQGYATGHCKGTECKCWYHHPPEYPPPKRCDTSTCHADCTRRRYSYGACTGPWDVCRCYY